MSLPCPAIGIPPWSNCIPETQIIVSESVPTHDIQVPSSLSPLVPPRPMLFEPWKLQKLALDGFVPHGIAPVPRCGSELGGVPDLPGHTGDPCQVLSRR